MWKQNTTSASVSLFGNEVINGLVFLQPLFYVDQKIDSVNHTLYQLHLRKAQAIWVGNVKHTSHGRCINAALKKGKKKPLIVSDTDNLEDRFSFKRFD